MFIEKKREYAQAIYDIAKEEDQIEKYLDVSLAIIDVCNSNKDIHAYLSSPSVDIIDKKRLISKIVSKPVFYKNWLYIIIESKNSKFIKEYISEYINIYNKHHNITKGFVWTTKYIDQNTIDRLEKQISKKINKKVMIENKIDKELIGGIKLQIGDDIWDNSIRSKLEQLLDKRSEKSE